ncbi:MAG: hypothetical protein ACK5Z5_08045 [Neisseriaceae bacterium]
MNNLGYLGILGKMYSLYNKSTGSTDRVAKNSSINNIVLNFVTTDDTTNVLSKLRGCYQRFITQEYKTQGWCFGLFGQTRDIRKANTCRYLVNNHKLAEIGNLSAESKKSLLGVAKKAMQFSRQIEHLFCMIANPGDNRYLKGSKLYCEDLLYLYSERDKLILAAESAKNGSDIGFQSQIAEDLNTINSRINLSEDEFKKMLNSYMNSQKNTAATGFSELIDQFQLQSSQKSPSGKYQVEDFIKIYAFKLNLITNPNYKTQVIDDFRQYIFSTSVGNIHASEIIAKRYGKVIANFLDESSLGDVDSKANISQYFMQTIYNLLNDGKPNFSLGELCIGANKFQQKNQSVSSQKFGDEDVGFENSYWLNGEGISIVENIIKYYNQLFQINGEDGTKLLDFDDERKKMLLWNLVGGTHYSKGNKKGIFYRIDEQLKGFTTKDDYSMHDKLVGFSKYEYRKKFVEELPQNPYLINREKSNDSQNRISKSTYKYSLKSLHYIGFNFLSKIAARCKLNDLDFEDRQDIIKLNQLKLLRLNYDSFMHKNQVNKTVFKNYFKNILTDDSYRKFMAIDINGMDVPDRVNKILYLNSRFKDRYKIVASSNIDDKNLGTIIQIENDNNCKFNGHLFTPDGNEVSIASLPVECVYKIEYNNVGIETDDFFYKSTDGTLIKLTIRDNKTESDINKSLKLGASLGTLFEEFNTTIANDCLVLAMKRKQIATRRKFELVLDDGYDINLHLNTYTEMTNELSNKLKNSPLYLDMEKIISGLSNLKEVTDFYKTIKDKKSERKEVAMITAPFQLAKLVKLAVLDTKACITKLYDRYLELDRNYGDSATNTVQKNKFKDAEWEIFEYSFLQTLFKFIDKQGKSDSLNDTDNFVTIILEDAIEVCMKKLSSMQYINLATDTINMLNSKRILLQLVKQKEILVQFMNLFVATSIDNNVNNKNLQNFINRINAVIGDLEIMLNKINNTKNNDDLAKKFRQSCIDINSWLLDLLINKDALTVSTKFEYKKLDNDEVLTIELDSELANLCKDNYIQLQGADFSYDWGQVSQVHKAIWINMLNTEDSLISKLSLYFGQFFSDGFTYKSDKESAKFWQLLNSHEAALVDNLEALNTMSYLNQELLGHYTKLIEGVQDLSFINTSVSLRSKLLIATLNNNYNNCNFTNDEKELYLRILYKRELYKYPRVDNQRLPNLVENANYKYFEANALQNFLNPSQIVQQILLYLNIENNDGNIKVDTALVNHAFSTANMIRDIEEKSAQLYKLFKNKKEDLERFKEGIEIINKTFNSDYEGLLISKDSIDDCNELLNYFIDPDSTDFENYKQKVDLEINIKKVNTLGIANIYKDIFNNLYIKDSKSSKLNELLKIKMEFDQAYDEIAIHSLYCDVAFFNIPSDFMLNIENHNKDLERYVINIIKNITSHDQLSSIVRPLDYEQLENIYILCENKYKKYDEKLLIKAYLNLFQYKKLEQCFAKFYININNNLPRLADNLDILYRLYIPDFTQSITQESYTNQANLKILIEKTNNYFNKVSKYIAQWKSLFDLFDKDQYNKYSWLVESGYDELNKMQRLYFEWFTKTYLKLGMVNSGATGAFRDELQFMVIIDYLKVYRKDNVENFKNSDIELIKNFYYFPDKLSKEELTQIHEILEKLGGFLNSNRNQDSVITGLLSQIKEYLNKFIDWLTNKSQNLENIPSNIQGNLQKLYNQFYWEVIAKANSTLSYIALQESSLNLVKVNYKSVCEIEPFSSLSYGFKKVKNGDDLYRIFHNNAHKFKKLEDYSSTIYLDLINLILEGIKRQNSREIFENVDVQTLKDVVDLSIKIENLSESYTNESGLDKLLPDVRFTVEARKFIKKEIREKEIKKELNMSMELVSSTTFS